MATRFNVTKLDDLDLAEGAETEAAETIRIGLGGDWYDVDLSGINANHLYGHLDRYIRVARKVAPGKRTPQAGGQAGQGRTHS